jgi:hypothetical protein
MNFSGLGSDFFPDHKTQLVVQVWPEKTAAGDSCGPVISA